MMRADERFGSTRRQLDRQRLDRCLLSDSRRYPWELFFYFLERIVKPIFPKHLQLIYDSGREAKINGKPENSNPYGLVDLRSRCLWAAGWHDAK